MKSRYIFWILCLFSFLTISGNAWSEKVLITDEILNASIMRPDIETRHKWKEDHEKAPRALIDEGIKTRLLRAQDESVGTSLNFLNYLQYTPSERDQGSCGNCWVWAGTGIMEIALSVQNGIKDRFSIQFLNSCNGTGTNYACCGGDLSEFRNWYNGQGLSISWDNTNASFADGSRQCSNNSSLVPCASISTTPNYSITSIQEQTITTTVDQSTAIANIKNILNQNKGVWFAFWLARQTDWNAFFSFWNNQPESAIWNPDVYCGRIVDAGAGGHAVLIAGYNDDAPANPYWIVLNSWGTTGGRPNGLFRMKMNMNYGCQNYYSGYGWSYDREFETLNITFSEGSCTYSISPTSQSFPASGGTGSVSVTTQSTCSWAATSNVSWITITSGSSGTGNGTVNYSVAANTGTSRTGTMTIAGRTFTVSQSASAPTITVTSPNNGSENWQVGTTHSITWTYTSNPGSYVKIELLKSGVLNLTIASSVSIGSGGSGSYNWTIPSTQTPGTDYKIRITSTSNSSVTDMSDNNFTISSKVALPDLVVTSVITSSSGTKGSKIYILAMVANQGTASAGTYRLGLYFSVDSIITTADTLAAFCNMPALAPGSSQTCSGYITVPSSLTPRTYYFGAFADDLGAVSESNESNNTRVRTIIIH